MSVAFRRESDEEHKEPTFEIPIAPGPNLVTGRGLQLIEERIAELDATIAAGREGVEPLKRELRYWQTRKATAVLAPPPPRDEVAFGSRVVVRMNGAERTLSIVGTDEADPPRDLIGFQAPLARALIGVGVGDFIEFGADGKEIEVIALDR